MKTEPQDFSLESTTSLKSDSDEDVLYVATHQNKRVKMSTDLEAQPKASEKEKFRLYEALIRDKDDLIKSLKWIAETKDKSMKQMKSQINDLQNSLDLKPQFNLCSAQGTSTNLKPIGVSDNDEDRKPILKSLNQIQEHDMQDQADLLNIIAKKEDQFKKDKDVLRSEIAKLEEKVKVISSELLEKDKQLCKYTSNAGNACGKQPTLLLNFTKHTNIKLVKIQGIDPFMAAFEDIDTAGSDWMVIQRRIDGTVSFSHGSELPFYIGFGDINREFWLGFELIHRITSMQRHELYVELVDFDDVKAYARYDNFVVGSRTEVYAIKSLGSYSGNAGDALSSLKNQTLHKWTCQDNSKFYWWYSAKMQCNLNGPYFNSKLKLHTLRGLWWGNWNIGQSQYSLKSCKMMIRRKFKSILT